MLWYYLLASPRFAAGSNPDSGSGGSVSLSLSLEGQFDEQSGSPPTHRVFVGASGALRFRPQYVEAAVGDLITFEFLARNHSVKQSSFDTPCVSNGGFDTEFWQDNPYNNSRHTVDLLVTTTTPQWFFCQQTIPWPHCSAGMVFAINPGMHWGDFSSRAHHHTSSSSSGTQSLATTSAQLLTGYPTGRTGTGEAASSRYTYDPLSTSDICGPTASTILASSSEQTLPPIVIVPLDTGSQNLERRTLKIAIPRLSNGPNAETTRLGTAVVPGAGNSRRVVFTNTTASGAAMGLLNTAPTGSVNSAWNSVCTGGSGATSTWHWPSQTGVLPSVQSVTAVSAASRVRSRIHSTLILASQICAIVWHVMCR